MAASTSPQGPVLAFFLPGAVARCRDAPAALAPAALAGNVRSIGARRSSLHAALDWGKPRAGPAAGLGVAHAHLLTSDAVDMSSGRIAAAHTCTVPLRSSSEKCTCVTQRAPPAVLLALSTGTTVQACARVKWLGVHRVKVAAIANKSRRCSQAGTHSCCHDGSVNAYRRSPLELGENRSPDRLGGALQGVLWRIGKPLC
jgi:hypothetical protein